MKDKSRTRDLAILLPWLGAFMFTPPILMLFQPSMSVLGVPLLPVYLFTMWLVLILVSRNLTSHLPASLNHSGEINRSTLLDLRAHQQDSDKA